jgi:hypothetical protein
MTIRSAISVVSVVSLSFVAGIAQAQSGIRTERVQCATGASAAEVKGQLKGDETVDKVRASAGQVLTAALKGANRQNYFNVNPPESEIAWHVGQDGGPFKGTRSTDGDDTIRVYLMRPAARAARR